MSIFKKGCQAFTMIELIIVFSIISVMAGFMMPSFKRMVYRTAARDAINNLTIIHSFQQHYLTRHQCYKDAATLADINTALGLDLASHRAGYFCNDACPVTKCEATNSKGTWHVTVSLADPIVVGVNPSCVSTEGGCP